MSRPRKLITTNPAGDVTVSDNNSDNNRKSRTAMHIVKIARLGDGTVRDHFVVIHDREVTALFGYSEESNNLFDLPDTFGRYAGLANYLRKCPECGTTILITKSPDVIVTSSVADKYAAESFIRTYLDRVKAHEEAQTSQEDETAE